MPERLWTRREVAEFIGVHPKTVLRWERDGDAPPPIRVGKYVRFSPDDVMQWIEARKSGQNRTS